MEPENPWQLAETIQYVVDNSIEADEVGRKAREKCEQKYSWDVMEESLVKIFEKYRTEQGCKNDSYLFSLWN